MKFKGSGHVWDSKKNKMLCNFINGEYETDNDYINDRLIELGYETINGKMVMAEYEVSEDEETVENDNYENMEITELRQLAKSNGIKNWHNKKVENILTELRGE